MSQSCCIITSGGLVLEVGREGVLGSFESVAENTLNQEVQSSDATTMKFNGASSPNRNSDRLEGVSLSRFDDAFQAEVSRCRLWFAQARQSDPPKVNSFWLQQFLNHWAGERLSQGAVIVAAFQSGFSIGYETVGRTASVTIGISNDSINQFDCGCGHP